MNPDAKARETAEEALVASGMHVPEGSAMNFRPQVPAAHPLPPQGRGDAPAGRGQPEEALRESEMRLRMTVKVANVGLWDWDLRANTVYYSPEWKSQIGYREEEISDSFEEWRSRVHPEDIGPAMLKLSAYLENPENRYETEFRLRHKDGSYRWIYSPADFLYDAAGRPMHMLGCHIDITERKQAEEALRESEAQLRLAVQSADVGLWDWDLRTDTVYYSPEWKRQIGYREDEISNSFEEWRSRVHPDDLETAMRRTAAFLKNPQNRHETEFRFRHKDGSYRWIYAQGDLVRDAAGKPVRMLGCHIDITERRRAEDELHRLSHRLLHAENEERRRIAKELHDSTAQDLVAVVMNLGLLQESLAPGDTKAARILADSIALVENSVNDIRTLSYVLHPPRLDETGLAGAIAEYAAGVTSRTDTRIRVEVAADFGRLAEQTEIALFRVVQESLANVLRHSGSDIATVRLAHEDGSVVLEIEDHGRGMADAAARGVGITGMRERLQHLGGRLEIESDSGGTIVRAVLPLREGRI
jgi:PAS domain S-box-containing protein